MSGALEYCNPSPIRARLSIVARPPYFLLEIVQVVTVIAIAIEVRIRSGSATLAIRSACVRRVKEREAAVFPSSMCALRDSDAKTKECEGEEVESALL